MNKQLLFKVVVVMAAILSSYGVFAQTQITNEEELRSMATNPSGEYVLANDIVLTGEWTPVGTEAAPFTGKFDGAGHAVKGLVVNQDAGFLGLFGCVSGASISNVRIEQADVRGKDHVGIAVGRLCNGSKVDRVMTSGYVTGFDHIGGIAGDIGEGTDNVITNCYSVANVFSTDYQAGGIVGWSKGDNTVKNNFFAGKVRVNGWGGTAAIVGFVEDGTTTIAYNVAAPIYIMGNTDGEEGNVWGHRWSYGAVGGILNENSIAAATDNLVSDKTKVINEDSGEEKDLSGLNSSYHGIITSDANLKTPQPYTTLGWDAAVWSTANGRYPMLSSMTVPFDGDYVRINDIPDELYVGNTIDLAPVSSVDLPVTITSSNTSVATVSGTKVEFVGAGTATITVSTTGDSYINGYTKSYEVSVKDMDNKIATAADFDKIRKNPQGDFVLVADIDFAGVDFRPIPNFSGSIDGQNHWVKNLTYINNDANKIGLIGVFSGSFIKNIGFMNIYLSGNADVAIIGKTEGPAVIEQVVVSESYIEGRDHVASFVGNIDGNATIKNCLSNARIQTREYQAGGIGGVINHGTVENCLFCGTINSYRATNIGGIVSLLDSDRNPSTIRNCLAAAVVENPADNDKCMINRANRNMTLENNYVTEYTVRNGAPIQAGEANDERGALARKTQVRSKDWYTSTLGWDFNNVWKFFPNAEGKMLPVLAWMSAPVATSFFNMPSEDGVALNFVVGVEKWEYSSIFGSWGQDVVVEQRSGTDYASIMPDENAIYAGDENAVYKGAGTATFKVTMDPSIVSNFTVIGRDEFDVHVAKAGVAIEIGTVEDFLKIRKNPGLDYILTADIDLSSVTDFTGFCNDGVTFSGSIDGNGHAVHGFNIDFSSKSDSDHGLFGKTSGATFKNIAFYDFVIDCGQAVDHVGLIGGGSATFENVAIVGTVIGDDHVGLVAGDSDGIKMTNCYAKGTVNGRSQVGGFFGCTLENGATLENCFTNVNSTATERGWVGGFIGLIDKPNSIVTIKNCVSVGNQSSIGRDKYTNSFIGGNNAGDGPNAIVNFTGNLYSLEAINDADTAWPIKNETAEGGNVQPATGKHNTELCTQAPYADITWDFNEVWAMGAGEYKYPVLKGVNVPDEILAAEQTGIDEVETGSEVSVTAAGGIVTVCGLGSQSAVNVYTAAGVMVNAISTTASEASIEVPAAGLYIITVVTDGKANAFKVLCK